MYIRIAFMIWLISAVCNTLLIITSLGFSDDVFIRDIWFMLFACFMLCIGFSVPAFLLLIIILSFCEDRNLTSRDLLKVIIIACAILTVSSYMVFTLTLGSFELLLFTSLASVAISIVCQWNTIKKLTSDHLQPGSHEN